MIFALIAVVAVAYLIGSINFAIIFSSLLMKKDIRELGSGNPGTTNMLRTGGFVPGILTFVGDALKGAVACGLGKAVFAHFSGTVHPAWVAPLVGAYLCGVACMLGHMYPVFFRFKGGKGVAANRRSPAMRMPSYGFAPDMSRRFQTGVDVRAKVEFFVRAKVDDFSPS